MRGENPDRARELAGILRWPGHSAERSRNPDTICSPDKGRQGIEILRSLSLGKSLIETALQGQKNRVILVRGGEVLIELDGALVFSLCAGPIPIVKLTTAGQ